MRNTPLPLSVAIGVLLGTTALKAQECESVIALSRGTKEVVRTKSEIEQFASSFCKTYNSQNKNTNSRQGEASFKMLRAGTKSANSTYADVAEKFCDKSNGSIASDAAFKEYVNDVSPLAYSAYQACIGMRNNALRFKVDVAAILPKSFSLVVSFTPTDPAVKSASLHYSTNGNSTTCYWGSRKTASPSSEITIPRQNSIQLTCNREDSGGDSVVQIVRTDGQDDPLTLRWPQYGKDGVPIDTVSALQRRIETLDSELQGLKAAPTILGAGLTSVCRSSSQSSPKFERVCSFDVDFKASRKYYVLTSIQLLEGSAGGTPSIYVEVSNQTETGFRITLHTAFAPLRSAAINWVAVAK